MKKNKLKILTLVFSILIITCCKEETTKPDEKKRPTQEEFTEITNNASVGQKGSYFINMLKSATIQFNDSSKLTMFVIIDNPYIKDVVTDEESYLKNHIVKGTYHLTDFGANTELTAINGNKIVVNKNNPEENYFRVNETESCNLSEVEINGNIVHYVYSPIFCSENDYTRYLNKTKELFLEFIEYAYIFDAILTDIADAIDASWTAIDNHTFNSENEKIEKLWFDSFYLISRAINLNEYNDKANSEIISENSLQHGMVLSILRNFFGGVPNYRYPKDMNEQFPNVSIGEMWINTAYKIEEARNLAQSNTIKDAASSLLSRENFLYKDFSSAVVLNEEIINSEKYSLEDSQTNFYSSIISSEIIWSIENPKKVNSEISRNKNNLPIFRYSETFMTYLYCAIELNSIWNSISMLQQFEEIKGYEITEITELTGSSSEVLNKLRDKLKNYFLLEFGFEGTRFMLLKNFDLVGEKLNMPDYMKLLPIPMKELNYNPNFVQNPGY